MRSRRRITLKMLLESFPQICRITDVKSIIFHRTKHVHIMHYRWGIFSASLRALRASPRRLLQCEWNNAFREDASARDRAATAKKRQSHSKGSQAESFQHELI